MPNEEEEDDVVETESRSGADARISRIAEQRRAARQERDDALRQLGELQKELKAASKLQSKLDEAQATIAAHESERAGWEEHRALAEAGLTDPEGIDLARAVWGRLPDERRPKGGLAEWVASDAAPRGVRAYLPAQAEKTEETARRASTTDRTVAVSTAGSTQPPYSAQRIAQMTGSEYVAARDATWASMGMAPPVIPGVPLARGRKSE